MDRLGAEIARQMGLGARASDPGDRTRAYQEAARLLVEAREFFLTDEGEPDWRGATYAYRRWVSGLYSDAGLRGDEKQTVSAAVRYHIGNALRMTLDEETLESLGMRTSSPRERSAATRAEKSALLKAVTGSSTGFSGLDGLRALTSANALLGRVEGPSLASLDAEGLETARGLLAEITKSVSRLSRSVSRRSGGGSAAAKR